MDCLVNMELTPYSLCARLHVPLITSTWREPEEMNGPSSTRNFRKLEEFYKKLAITEKCLTFMCTYREN
ncbi:hypothetical protein JTB14_029342 [Gonioctena quinquepunctata]|nr:hypothetical protein JTB14_029342 [Gonioctena quinquepunctata]